MIHPNLKAIIVDDEVSGRNTLKQLLSKFTSIQLMGEASNITEAYGLINTQHPNLVFLDIEMPYGSGFDLLEKFNPVPFEVIFVTAFEEYALRALKLSATDYLLKPIEENELRLAIDKAIHKNTKYPLNYFKDLGHNYQAPHTLEKIAIPSHEGIIYLPIQDIIRCESEKGYTRFYTKDKKKYLVSRTLGEYEQVLNDFGFFRIHYSHIVNLHFVEKYQKGRGGSVIMNDQKEIEVSVRRKEEFLEQMKNLSKK